MFTKHYGYTFRTEAIECIDKVSHLIDFGVYALAGCTNFMILHKYTITICYVHFGCSNLMLHRRAHYKETAKKGSTA